jgi:hypothetical protein
VHWARCRLCQSEQSLLNRMIPFIKFTNHTAWLETNSSTLCSYQDLSCVRRTCTEYVIKVKQFHNTPTVALGGEELQLLLIHDLGTRWKWVVSVTPRPRFNPWEMTRGTYWTGGWVAPRAGLDTEARRKSSFPPAGIELWCPGRPVRSHTLYWLSYPDSQNMLLNSYKYKL